MVMSLASLAPRNRIHPRFLCRGALPAGQNHYAVAHELDGEPNGEVPY